jgi:putative transposase
MRFTPNIFGQLLESLNRRLFQTIVDRHDGDAYDKSFKSWDHLVALIYAQFCASSSLRGLATNWNANSQHHYHLASGPLKRSTLSDANQRRPVAVFAETFSLVAGQLDRQVRRESKAMLRLIDSANSAIGPSRTAVSAA